MPNTLRGVHALIVEDEPTHRSILRAMLAQVGIDVTEAAAGPEALAAFDVLRFDVIVLDYMMPGMDGLEVLHEIRARERTGRRRRTPVVMISAAMDQPRRLQALKEHADYVLSKPYERATLIGAVADVLGRLPPLAS